MPDTDEYHYLELIMEMLAAQFTQTRDPGLIEDIAARKFPSFRAPSPATRFGIAASSQSSVD